jgi:hypothetical protein
LRCAPSHALSRRRPKYKQSPELSLVEWYLKRAAHYTANGQAYLTDEAMMQLVPVEAMRQI